MKTKDLALIALFAALMVVCSWITIPGPVPFTLQTFAVFLSLGLLGGKRGTAVIGLYLLMGAVGLPVFSGFQGGLGSLLGATGGYKLGFLLIGAAVWLAVRLRGESTRVLVLAMSLGLVLCYAAGTAWFVVVYTRNTGAIGVGAALSLCVLPFIIPDALKMALALYLRKRIRKQLAVRQS